MRFHDSTALALAALAMTITLTAANAAPGKEKTTMTQSNDEKTIIELHTQFGAAWGRGDADALARMFAEDGMRVGASGDVAHGRAEIRASFDKLFAGPFTGATVKIGEASVRMVGPEHALWEAPIEIAMPASQPVKGYVVELMLKRGGAWQILESHPKLYPQPRGH